MTWIKNIDSTADLSKTIYHSRFIYQFTDKLNLKNPNKNNFD